MPVILLQCKKNYTSRSNVLIIDFPVQPNIFGPIFRDTFWKRFPVPVLFELCLYHQTPEVHDVIVVVFERSPQPECYALSHRFGWAKAQTGEALALSEINITPYINIYIYILQAYSIALNGVEHMLNFCIWMIDG